MVEDGRNVEKNLARMIQSVETITPTIRFLALASLEERPDKFFETLVSRWDEVQAVGHKDLKNLDLTEKLAASEGDVVLTLNEITELRPFNKTHLRRLAPRLGGERVKGVWHISLARLDEYVAQDPRRKPRRKDR